MNCKRGVFLLTGFIISFAYDNLSYKKNALQSSTSIGTSHDAKNAVDENTTTCMRSGSIGQNSPEKAVWWKVDLGAVYNIHSVNIIFRNYDDMEMRQRGRFAGFSLFVSTTGVLDNTSLCYKDGPELPHLNITINCTTLGHYVIFFNERLYGVTYPEGYEPSIYVELCEVIVYGCNQTGVYGSNCDIQCPMNCKYNVCHIENGTCFECDAGWRGEYCNETCYAGWHGKNCKHRCLNWHCKQNTSCNHVTGLCEEGCAAGWKGSICDETCDDGTFGFDCASNCSGQCFNDYPCSRQTGHCQGGCKPGYVTEKCNETCSPGFYGQECRYQCTGYCLNKTICDHKDGTCTYGCHDGYIGKFCNISCANGYYGKNCSSVCSPNCKTCRHTDGQCSCFAGWNGFYCSTECSKSYGEGCKYECSQNCFNQSCDKVDMSVRRYTLEMKLRSMRLEHEAAYNLRTPSIRSGGRDD
ncbi:uncharacterized protein LOC111117643 [Crassostrea virginica]